MESFASIKENIKTQIDLISDEMKRIGFWNDIANIRIDVEAYEESNLSLENWIRYVYLEKLKIYIDSLDENDLLPYKIGLIAFRNWDYMSTVPKAENLINMLYKLEDEIIDFVNLVPRDYISEKIKWFIEAKKEKDIFKI